MDQSAPLCMRNLFAHLKDEHHLRHNGRMQLGLFLKGVGLGIDDALLFWRTEFCRKITPEQFEKQYAYNVRHNYGREGKRQDYTPYPCMKARRTLRDSNCSVCADVMASHPALLSPLLPFRRCARRPLVPGSTTGALTAPSARTACALRSAGSRSARGPSRGL